MMSDIAPAAEPGAMFAAAMGGQRLDAAANQNGAIGLSRQTLITLGCADNRSMTALSRTRPRTMKDRPPSIGTGA
jgi:hypothetical protein